MIEIDIPGRDPLQLAHLVMDVNGTIAEDGNLVVGVVPRIYQLAKRVELHLLTADTHGTQKRIDTLLDMQAHIITGGAAEKAAFVQKLNAPSVVAIGNGTNDVSMCEQAGIGIAVLGPEGLSARLLSSADILVRDITDGMDLLLYPERLRATLRD